MRIAWIGPMPSNDSGPSHSTTQLLPELCALGLAIDCFVSGAEREIPEQLREVEGLRFVCFEPDWSWGRWYSRTPLTQFLTGQAARARAQRRLYSLIARRHHGTPYGVLVQYSQIELAAPARLRAALPPIVLNPSVHAAGELRWHRRESALARRCEPPLWTATVRAMLAARTARQRRDIRAAALVAPTSRRFASHLARDYGVDRSRFRVAPNPINLARFTAPPPRVPGRPVTLLFVSRMSVRKGVDMVVELSRRLTDLAGRVEILAVGDHTLWSDYRPLLRELEPSVARYLGPVPALDLAKLYQRADGLVQPALYEPFGLTVAEALASGLPVAASDEVGAAEDVDARCCVTFRAGDPDGFEHATRELVRRVEGDERTAISALARREAERLFSSQLAAARLAGFLEEAAGVLPSARRAA
jgi:glycosyltransferase involved in cell wall biosynthesis